MRSRLILLPICALAIALAGSFFDHSVSVATPAAAATPAVKATLVVTPTPDAAPTPTSAATPNASMPPASADSVRLAIPAIGLNDPIEPVGLNSLGQMAVPDGGTNYVGWYENGTIPGGEGSAVLDAHVFAAFKALHSLAVGDDIYVTTEDGATLRFRVYETDTYLDADVPLARLFNQTGGKYLNLITCAGKLTPDHSTYDHRFVAYAELVSG